VHYLKYLISFVKEGASKKQEKTVLWQKTTNTYVAKRDLDMAKNIT
jgi:hypothetical protein